MPNSSTFSNTFTSATMGQPSQYQAQAAQYTQPSYQQSYPYPQTPQSHMYPGTGNPGAATNPYMTSFSSQPSDEPYQPNQPYSGSSRPSDQTYQPYDDDQISA